MSAYARLRDAIRDYETRLDSAELAAYPQWRAGFEHTLAKARATLADMMRGKIECGHCKGSGRMLRPDLRDAEDRVIPFRDDEPIALFTGCGYCRATGLVDDGLGAAGWSSESR